MRSFSHIASLLPLASPDRYGASCKIRRNQAPSAHASALPASIVPLAPAPTPRRPYCALRGPTVNRGHFHPVRTAAHLPPQLTHSMHLPYLPDLIPDLCPPVCLLTCPPYLPDMIPDLCPPVWVPSHLPASPMRTWHVWRDRRVGLSIRVHQLQCGFLLRAGTAHCVCPLDVQPTARRGHAR